MAAAAGVPSVAVPQTPTETETPVTPHSAATLLLLLAAIGWILTRQVRPAQVRPRMLVLAPVLLGYAGLDALPSSLTAADLGFLLVGALASAALGVWRGATIVVWHAVDGWWRRGTGLTLVLWGALLVVRAALAAVEVATGHPHATGTGALLVGLAVSFAAQNAVVATRVASAGRAPAAA